MSITITIGPVCLTIEGGVSIGIEEETITPEDGAVLSIDALAGAGFDYPGSENHEDIYWAALAHVAPGVDPMDVPQPDTKEFEAHVIHQETGLVWRAYRRWEEGWGVGTEAINGGAAAPPAGMYTVTAFVTRTWGP